MLFDPQLVPAIVNLANIHYERDELVEAEALYEKAIRVDVDCFEAYFNLGNIHHDLARYAEAVSAYRDALAINPAYPEAHFYLAVTLEKLGRSVEAKRHWREYRRAGAERRVRGSREGVFRLNERQGQKGKRPKADRFCLLPSSSCQAFSKINVLSTFSPWAFVPLVVTVMVLPSAETVRTFVTVTLPFNL